VIEFNEIARSRHRIRCGAAQSLSRVRGFLQTPVRSSDTLQPSLRQRTLPADVWDLATCVVTSNRQSLYCRVGSSFFITCEGLQGAIVIKSITIQGFKSFDEAVPTVINLDPSKRVALFYGVNGAGKSAIAQVLARHGADAVPGCAVEFTRNDSYQILVYNEAFVDRTFRNRASVPGIFTIGEPAAEALGRAEALEYEMAVWKDTAERLGDERRVRQGEAASVTTVAHESVWSAYTEHKGTVFQPWLGGFGASKQKLFDWLRGMDPPLGQVPQTKEDLAVRLTELGEQGAQPRVAARPPMPDFRGLEVNPLWSEAVVPTGKSQLSALINVLGNADWVRHGQGYLAHSDQHCPFCQQGLPPDFSDQLSRLFDTSYNQSIDQIHALASAYETRLDAFSNAIATLIETEPFAQEDPELAVAWGRAQLLLRANATQMGAKRESPATPVSLVDTGDALAPVDAALARVATRVEKFNERLGRWQTEYSAIKRDFYARLRYDYDGAIGAYNLAVDAVERAVAEIDAQQVFLRDQIHAGEQQLVLLRASTAGTEHAVKAINSRLLALGVDSFRIAKQAHGDLYHLQRGDARVDDYQSLSEGEKTLITFLYFVELVSGSEVADRTVPLHRKIVVIDDPISSLSHNYVYDVAATIVRDIIELKDEQGRGLKQVIVLTHSLFFHHELLSVVGNARSLDLHRVRKHTHSEVVALRKEDLLNDYEAYWQVVKDAREGRATCATLANAMRCILERFFYFTRRQDDFKTALKALSDADHRFLPLSRYLDRQSHADGNTRTDFSDYDLNYYLTKFEAVFTHAKETGHYAAMMGLESEDAGT